jgi:hypothetical protein
MTQARRPPVPEIAMDSAFSRDYTGPDRSKEIEMDVEIRQARPEDASALAEIAQMLRLTRNSALTARNGLNGFAEGELRITRNGALTARNGLNGLAEGELRITSRSSPASPDRGFLMGNSLDDYAYFIENDDVLVIEDRASGGVAGFSIVIGPDTIVRSGLWKKTEEIHWEPSFEGKLDLGSSAIFEQIALDPRFGGRLFANYLAFASLERALSRYLRIFASVARYPVQNRASLPFLERTGWRRIGDTDENFPGYGRFEYDIYCLERSAYEARLKEPPFVALGRRVRACMG